MLMLQVGTVLLYVHLLLIDMLTCKRGLVFQDVLMVCLLKMLRGLVCTNALIRLIYMRIIL